MVQLTELRGSLRTRRPAVQTLEPDGMWAYLRGPGGEAAVFARAMEAKASGEIAAVLAAYDYTRFARIADIGGGRGHLLRAVLDAALPRRVSCSIGPTAPTEWLEARFPPRTRRLSRGRGSPIQPRAAVRRW